MTEDFKCGQSRVCLVLVTEPLLLFGQTNMQMTFEIDILKSQRRFNLDISLYKRITAAAAAR